MACTQELGTSPEKWLILHACSGKYGQGHVLKCIYFINGRGPSHPTRRASVVVRAEKESARLVWVHVAVNGTQKLIIIFFFNQGFGKIRPANLTLIYQPLKYFRVL